MRHLLLSFIGLIVVSNCIGQEIVHDHSIHHAFVENKGQWPDQVLFKSKFDGGNLWIEQKKLMFHLQDYSDMHAIHSISEEEEFVPTFKQDLIHVEFIGSNDVTSIEKNFETESYHNYFIGNDESKWASNVHGYGEAILREFYNGIDLKLIEQHEELKYEFHVLPEMDPNQILLDYTGQQNVSINDRGDLVVSTKLGKIIEQKPYAYQIVNGRIKEVECSFKIDETKGDIVTFNLGKYNPNVTLVIDPTLVFATYCGSVTDNFGMTATYGYDETAYSGGVIYGNAYPTPDPTAYNTTSTFTVADNPTYGITDAFVTRYSPDGTNMIWTTFLGGGDGTQGTETAQSMICDENNNLYIYGATSSTDFPIQGGYQGAHAGGTMNSNFYYNGVYFSNQGTDIYVAKISANGQNLMASTYIGGSLNDGINYNINGGIYNNVAAYDSLTLNYGDQFRGEIMLDSIGNCLIASCTRSLDFPTQIPFQAANAGGQDGVVFKLNSSLSSMQWSSYYGGSMNDACYSVKIDSSHNIVFVGGTSSTNLPGMGAGWQTSYNGGITDGFVVKLAPAGNSISYASYLGTSDYDQAFFVEIDRNDNVFVLGQSEGGNFPVVNAIFVNPGSSQFVVKLEPTLSTPLNSTVFGNGDPTINISPAAFLVDICGNIYISGWGANILQGTGMSGMPTTWDAFQINPPNGFDFYLLVIKREMTDILYGTYMGGPSANEHVDGGTSRFDKNGICYQSVCGGCGGNSDFPTTVGAWSDQNLSTNCNNLVFKFDFNLIPNAEFTTDDNLGCASFQVTFDNSSSLSDAYLWDFGNGDTTSIIFNPTMIYDTAGIYDVYLYVTDSICLLTDTAFIQITVTDSLEISTTVDQQICAPTPIDLTAFTNGTATTFVWSTSPVFADTLNTNLSDSTVNVTPSGPMTYYVSASNSGCSITDSVVVDFIGSSLILNANDSICAGDISNVLVTSTNPLITFDTYIWEPDSILVSPSTTNTVDVQPYTTQYVSVTAMSNTGCVVEDSILINVGNINGWGPNATATELLVPEGGTTTLLGLPGGLAYYNWSPPEDLDDPNAQNTDAVINEPTIFTLTASDGICTMYDTVFVNTYDFICGLPYVFVPNAFTPDNDNENDVLYVRGGLIKEMTFRVYTRWGELIFESFDRANGWDGTFRGKAMDPDVYDYYLKVICVDDEESIIKGNITLIR